MGYNKFVINGQTKLDISGDTVASNKMLAGTTAHDSEGEPITGTMSDIIFLTKAEYEAITPEENQLYGITDWDSSTPLKTVWSNTASAVTGATSVTITDTNIHTTSIIEPFADNGTDEMMAPPTVTATEGQCVLEFDALEADTTFRLRITNL